MNYKTSIYFLTLHPCAKQEYMQAGSYIVSFDGSRLSSGIYFYRLESGNFVQVRRMVLIK